MLGLNQIDDAINMGTFAMDDQLQDFDQSGGSFRVFPLMSPLEVRAVTFQFEDNFGSEEFTCVYRLQLLGESTIAPVTSNWH